MTRRLKLECSARFYFHILKGEIMSIRIISSRKFRFYSPDRQENIVVEGKNIISTVPDWAVKDGTFQAARAAGLIQILSSRQELKQAESNPEKVVPQNAHDHGAKKEEVEDTEPSLFPEELKEEDAGFEVDNIPEGDPEEESKEDAEAAKKAAKKAARAARRAKKAK